MKHKKMKLGAVLITAAVVLAACGSKDPAEDKTQETGTVMSAETEKGQAEGKAEYHQISQEDAKGRMDSGDKLVILDVRTLEEYEEKHIKGAIVIPNEEITEEPLGQLPDLDEEILVYCRTGVRSKEASEKLVKAGYTKVYDMGGINDWKYETETGGAEVTEAAGETGEESQSAQGGGNSAQDPMAQQNDNPSLSAFSTKDLDGNTVTQDVFKEYDLTMVNIWATFCGPCLREMPELGEIHSEYQDKGFQIVGIVTDTIDSKGSLVDSQVEVAKTAAEETGASYTHLLPSMDLLLGTLQDVSVVPTTIFVDKDGNQVGDRYEGAKSKEDWKAIIDGLLEEVK